jgi:Flp pilus assembly protein TadG
MITLITPKGTSRKVERYRGTVLVETAIVILLLLMVTLGIMAFGYLFLRAEQITNAARQGARLACVPNPGDVATVIDNYLTSQHIDHEFPSIVQGTVAGKPVFTSTVKGTNLDIMHIAGFLPIGDTFTASVTMAKEGP